MKNVSDICIFRRLLKRAEFAGFQVRQNALVQ